MALPNPLPGPLPNRAGEPEFQLKLIPDCIVFNCGGGKPVWCDMALTNPGASKETFKVKCTSAEVFRVQPPIGVVGSNETTRIRIWFQNKTVPEQSKHRHYFAVYHMKCDNAITMANAKDAWAKSSKPDGVRRLTVFFDKNATGPSGAPAAAGAAPAAPPAAGAAAPAAPEAAPAK